MTSLRLESLEPRLLLAGDFWVARVAPMGGAGQPFDTLEIEFNHAADETTFTLDDISISGSGGPIDPAPDALSRLAADRYQLDLTGLTGLDTYQLTVGPDVADLDGDRMNQDRDATPGEPEDAYRAALFSADTTIAGDDFTYDGQALVFYGTTSEIFFDHTFPAIELLGGASVLWIGGAPQLDAIRVDGGSTFMLGGRSTTNVSTIAVTGNSTLLCLGANTRDRFGGEWFGAGVTIYADTVTVAEGSIISADGQGYAGGDAAEGRPAGSGPGGGGHHDAGAGGGGYGGIGGIGSFGASGGAQYGSELQPLDLGSGGGDNSDDTPPGAGGAGGGAIRLTVADTLIVNGSIRADGGDFFSGGAPGVDDELGGGSGGSVYITADAVQGSGTIQAQGGDGAIFGGGGGGGRVVIEYATTFSLPLENISVAGGGGFEVGGEGTISVIDLTPMSGGPYVAGIQPPAHTNDPSIDIILLSLSQPVADDGAIDPATYTLLFLGWDREVGGDDDEEISITPSYVEGSTLIELQLASVLPEGLYQLTARTGVTTGLHDLMGRPLDQNQDGHADDLVTLLDVDLTTPDIWDLNITDSEQITISFYDEGGLDPATVTDLSAYACIGSGGDGTFDDGNEVDFTAAIDSAEFDPELEPSSCTLHLASPLPDNVYQITVYGSVVRDLAGNYLLDGDDHQSTILHWATYPSVAIDLQAASDSGISDTDDLTNDVTPTFDVTVNKAGTVWVQVHDMLRNEGQDSLGPIEVDHPGTYTISAPELPDSLYSFRASLSPDLGWNTYSSAGLQVTIDATGPQCLRVAQAVPSPYFQRQFRFSESIEPASFTVEDTRLAAPDGTDLGPVLSIEGADAEYTLTFDPVSAQGTYTLALGPEIIDPAGNLMDQNTDGACGDPADRFEDPFSLGSDLAPGLWVSRILPTGENPSGFDKVQLVFSRPVDDATFTADTVHLTDSGSNEITLPSPPVRLGQQWYELDYTGQIGAGVYSLTVDSAVLGLSGQPMDQDHDGTPGEAGEDAYQAHLVVGGLTLPEGDDTLDGQNLILWGGASTIEGAHPFSAMLVLADASVSVAEPGLTVENFLLGGQSTLSIAGGSVLDVAGDLVVAGSSTLVVEGKNTDGQVGGQWVGEGGTIRADTAVVESGSTISADGHGYSTGQGPGAGIEAYYDETYSWRWAGATHGGQGGKNTLPTYGSATEPMDLGSAGRGQELSTGWSYGGGAIRLEIADRLALDGEITADQVSHWPGAGYGSFGSRGAGGSVYVTTQVLEGDGKFTADGSADNPYIQFSSGGGRIAVYYQDASRFTEPSDSTVSDGYFSCTSANYGSGTVGFFDTSFPNTELKVYRTFAFGEDSTPHFGAVTVVPAPSTESWDIGPGAMLRLAGACTLTVDQDLTLAGSHTAVYIDGKNKSGLVDDQWAGEGATIRAENVTIPDGAVINAAAQGHIAQMGPAGYATTGQAGNHGAGPWTYGDAFAPIELGSGGRVGVTSMSGMLVQSISLGGGAVRLDVSGTLHLDGHIDADASGNGGTWYDCLGAAGGSIYVTTDVLSGSGRFTAQGQGPYGGGGRIAVYYRDATEFSGAQDSSAAGARELLHSPAGAPGTMGFFDTSVAQSHLYVYERFATREDRQLHLDGISVVNQATLEIGGGSLITLDHDLLVADSSTIICRGSRTYGRIDDLWEGAGVTIRAEHVLVDDSSEITADGQGYAAGQGPGAGGIGGSHGGRGAGESGPTYGDAESPNDLGSGGSGDSPGGGAIRLDVSDLIRVDGRVTANGTYNGAGGSICIVAGTLDGDGRLNANGPGAGGGGRVAVHFWESLGLPIQRMTATGAQPGSVVASSDVSFRWADDSGGLFHDTETIAWEAFGALTTSLTVDVLAAGRDERHWLELGAPALGTTTWDTTAVPDGIYELRAVFRDQTDHIIAEITRNVLVNHSVVWHGGLIGADETWAAGVVHLVERNATVLPGVTLTVEPGAVVKFAPGARLILDDSATLEALATADDPIVFTVLADDTGGDINFDADHSLPRPGDWGGIVQAGGAVIESTEYVEIRYGALNHSGTLAADQTWAGTWVHTLTGEVAVPNGVTLTIEPGAVIKAGTDQGILVQSGGQLIAEGTPGEPIIFTSIFDDSFAGDTNGDGTATEPAAGDWRWIFADSGQVTLEHVHLLYGGGSSGGYLPTGVLRADYAAFIDMSNCVLRDSLYEGILAWDEGDVTAENTVIAGCDRAVNADSGSEVHLVNCTIDDNRQGLWRHGGQIVAENCIVSNSLDAGALGLLGGSVTLRYSNVWSTTGDNYRGVPDQTGLNGNVSVDPQYKDSARGNYRFRYVSPMIDAADGTVAPESDQIGAPRYDDPRTADTGIATPTGAFADMGAFEFVESAISDVDLVPQITIGAT